MRFSLIAGSIAVAVAAAGCGGSSSTSTTAPSTTSTETIEIVGNLGAQSFSPNPETASAGNMIVWHNSDTRTHHIVLDDGSLDSGVIAPGASSTAQILNDSRATYHCTIHPTMVGSINTATTMPAPGPGY